MVYEDYERPAPTGRVHIIMKSKVTGTPRIYIKANKTLDKWLDLTLDSTNINDCWAFSKQGAKAIVERFKTKTYKENYDKGLIEFELWDEYT